MISWQSSPSVQGGNGNRHHACSTVGNSASARFREEPVLSALSFCGKRLDRSGFQLPSNGIGNEAVNGLGPGKHRALRGTPVVQRRQEFVRGAHLERSQLLLC